MKPYYGDEDIEIVYLPCDHCRDTDTCDDYTKTIASSEGFTCWNMMKPDMKSVNDLLERKEDAKQQTLIDAPMHYSYGDVECITAIESSMSPEAFKGYLKGNIQKYIWRYDLKGTPKQDLLKAAKYLGWLIEQVD
jgi:hypothetical protein